jgi:transcriptional regulator
MHPNPSFRDTADPASIALLRDRSFGTLALSADPAPLLAHVPFLLNEAADVVDLHLVRSNPIARLLKTAAQSAKLSVLGPDSYISPDWYEVPDQVPTWNYVAVHLTGMLELRPQDELHALLDRQSAHFETRLAPKPEWTSAKMSPGVMEKMMRAIVPVRLHIETLDSTWKLGQNKPDEVRRAAASQAAASQAAAAGVGVQTQDLGAFMQDPPDTRSKTVPK